MQAEKEAANLAEYSQFVTTIVAIAANHFEFGITGGAAASSLFTAAICSTFVPIRHFHRCVGSLPSLPFSRCHSLYPHDDQGSRQH